MENKLLGVSIPAKQAVVKPPGFSVICRFGAVFEIRIAPLVIDR